MKQNTIIVAIASGAICFAIGFIGGALLTMPNREKTKSTIAAVEAKAEAAKEETKHLKNELSLLTAKLEQANNELKRVTIEQKQDKEEVNPATIETKGSSLSSAPKKKVEEPIQSAISQPMFGIFLDETLDSLRGRFTVAQSTFSFEDKDHPGKIWSVQNDNPNVKQLLVYTYGEKVYTIDIQFTDGSRANYETIKDQLEKKYKSKDEGGLTGALFGEGDFKTVIDGVEIKIKLNHDIGFMEDGKLELFYRHITLEQKVNEEIQRRKASKISSEL
jgi:hypothetical protein